jgi:hypothetical protein
MVEREATKGSAPYGNWSYDSNNHMVNYGWDANGNMTSSPGGAMTYDVENRVTTAGGDQYAYAPGNQRMRAADRVCAPTDRLRGVSVRLEARRGLECSLRFPLRIE